MGAKLTKGLGIKFVQQPTSKTCVHACLAMVTGQPVQDIVLRFGDRGIGAEEEVAFLTENGLLPVPMNRYAKNYFSETGLYLITAPSLNLLGKTHRLVVVIDNNWDFTILDPNAGRKGKKYYSRNGFFTKRGISYSDVVHLVEMKLHKGLKQGLSSAGG